jgi:4-hydroxybenzoate polyprenyltransferase
MFKGRASLIDFNKGYLPNWALITCQNDQNQNHNIIASEAMQVFKTSLVTLGYEEPWRLIKELIQSMRPYQWYKNLIIFVGIVFSYNMFNLEMWKLSLFAFAMFCLISGSVYIINDIKDIEKERLHPKKRARPIAAGTISPRIALFVSILLLFAAITTSFSVNEALSYSEIVYICINLLYTFYLKCFALIDVMVVGAGFVLRAIAGSLAIDVRVSPWLVLCVFLMAFVLAFGKRRHELLIARTSRDSLSQYTEKMIENLLNISVSMLLMAYALYTFNVHTYMMITLPFASYGVFRFVQLIYLKDFGGEAELLLKDRPTLANLALWMASVIVVLYEVHP